MHVFIDKEILYILYNSDVSATTTFHDSLLGYRSEYLEIICSQSGAAAIGIFHVYKISIRCWSILYEFTA